MSEHESARRWRDSQKLSRIQLGELIGYSPAAINALERGEERSAHVWRRYKAACLLLSILRQFPDYSLEKWTWGQ